MNFSLRGSLNSSENNSIKKELNNKDNVSKESNDYTLTTLNNFTKISESQNNESKNLNILKINNNDDKDELFGSNITFGNSSINSSKVINNENIGKNSISYKNLIKRIATQLKKRVKLPTNKILKIYQSYTNLIFRIAKGIKKTSNKMNFDEAKDNKNSKTKLNIKISITKKETNNYSKNINLENNYNDNINLLLNIDDSNQNINFTNQFENYLEKNDIEILFDSLLPLFKNEDNKYLLTNIFFWKKYILYICIKYPKKLSFYHFMNFIEQFYLWIDNENHSKIFKKFIIEQMELFFDKEKINEYLLMYKLNSLEDLFARFKSLNNEFNKEIKLEENCKCPTCINPKIKIINYNKKNSYISYSDENFLDFGIKRKLIYFPEYKIKFDDTSKSFTIKGTNNIKEIDKRITDFFRSSAKIRTSKNEKIKEKKSQSYNLKDKKITDYFSIINKESKKKSSKKSKKDKFPNKIKEILELLNLEPDEKLFE